MDIMPPSVSIIVPCYNEQATIRQLLDAILRQDYPRAQMEVVIADGHSQDGTRAEIAAFQVEHPDLNLRIVDNNAGTIPSAVNCGIRAAQGDFIVRMDAHSQPYPDYVRRCVAALEAGLGDNVGGVWEIKPGSKGWFAQSIAHAAAHPLGAGDARYRRPNAPASIVDTVPFGAFHHSLVEKIGLYDETLLSNEDYEFNVRIRQAGGRIWLDPDIVTVYYARSKLRDLARQYWRYGYWKLRMLIRYPDTLRWRQALPPVFVASVLVLAALAWCQPAAWLLGLELASYAAVLILAGAQAALHRRTLFLLPGLPLAIFTMHFAWGGGFLWSLLTLISGNQKHG